MTMSTAIAANIRYHRERLSWTQECLAEAAQLNVRTVQRAEEGQRTSAETLTAIAGALQVSLEELRTDPVELMADLLGVSPEDLTPELLESKMQEAKANYMTVPLAAVSCSADMEPIFQAESMYLDCIPASDEIQDAAAELRAMCSALMNAADDLDPLDRREHLKAAYRLVERLGALGCAVSLGLHRHALRDSSERAPMAWRTLYVIVSNREDAKKVVMVPKGLRMSFQY